MNVRLPAGKYVLAVSGGVDSMALLHMLAEKSGVEMVVAHFNHGIRADSSEDAALVKRAAAQHGLIFEVTQGRLGPNASEATAREARYAFLEQIRLKHAAAKIITAHHQDDLIETAFINLIRGTGRHGLSAISVNTTVQRPLLTISKRQIIEYASRNQLEWREDVSNSSETYLRNYLRVRVLSSLTDKERTDLIINLDKVAKINSRIDNELATLSQTTDNQTVDRDNFSNFPVEVGNELVAFWLRKLQIKDYDSKTVNRLNMAIRTSKISPGLPVKNGIMLKISQTSATFVTP